MWHEVCDSTPPDKELVEIQTASGMTAKVRFHNNLWWTPDMEMYVYFTPIRWRHLCDSW